ncbi:MAG: DUF5624 domain-containing protein [Desulfobacterales bacterium]|nr:MAG: DUF5624 domain-containing protein [Desulfobacterales bacterium]
MAGDYLVRVRDGKVKAFSQKSVGEDFYVGGLEDYPVPFNNVMIATFMLVALNSADQIRTLVEQTAEKVDWKNARVLVHMPIGTNYGAGLTVQTNQLAHALTVLTDDALQDVNVLIAPYGDAPCPGASVTGGCPLEVFQKAVLDPAVFEFYSTRAWFGIYNRTQIAENAFWNVKPLEPFKFPARPDDYGFTKADDIIASCDARETRWSTSASCCRTPSATGCRAS